jgi:hypothetical protein
LKAATRADPGESFNLETTRGYTARPPVIRRTRVDGLINEYSRLAA